MKYKDEVAQNGKPVFYAVLYNDMRKAAIECGYALALHGSMQNDMDMIAVAWTEEAKSEVELVKAVNACLGATIWVDHIFTTREVKPHGRITYTLFISGDWRIDLTVVAPAQHGHSELEEVKKKMQIYIDKFAPDRRFNTSEQEIILREYERLMTFITELSKGKV